MQGWAGVYSQGGSLSWVNKQWLLTGKLAGSAGEAAGLGNSFLSHMSLHRLSGLLHSAMQDDCESKQTKKTGEEQGGRARHRYD